MKLQEEDKCTVYVPHLRLCRRKIRLIQRNKELCNIYIFFRSMLFSWGPFYLIIKNNLTRSSWLSTDAEKLFSFTPHTHAHTRSRLQRHFQCCDAFWNCEVEKGFFFPVNKTLFIRSAALSHTLMLYRQCQTQWWTAVCYFRFCFIIITEYYAFICHLAGN